MTKPEDHREPLPSIRLAELPAAMREAVSRAGWSDLMPVQQRGIPYLLAGRDMMIQSHTGSGKTGAFLLPLLERIDQQEMSCQALVMVPTRELARQVGRDAELLFAGSDLRTVAVYGGVAYGPQIEAFCRGAQLVVGTPGRVLDHLLKRSMTLDELRVLVFDEADRMLSMGFYPDMQKVKGYLPRRRISGYMFSATYPPFVLRMAGEFLHEPQMLSLSRESVHVLETEHVYYRVPAMEKDRCLVRIIEIENPTSALIFCNTKARVHYVAAVLQRFGYDADELSADLAQNAREHVMERVRRGTLRFLVATDVAARGIDIPELSHVIQYELPEDPEAYIHRTGRTGRAGASGEAIALVDVVEHLNFSSMVKGFGIKVIERPVPRGEDVAAIASQRVTALLEARLRARDRLQIERMQRFLPLVRSLGESPDEASLMAMLIDDYYQNEVHGRPPELPRPAPSRPQRESDRRRSRGGRRRRS